MVRVAGQKCDIVSILEIRYAGAIRQGRAKMGALGSNVPMKAIKEQSKEGGAQGTTLFYPSQGGDRGTNPAPHLDYQAGGGIQGLHSSKHTAVNAKAAKDLPQEGAVHMVIGGLQGQGNSSIKGHGCGKTRR